MNARNTKTTVALIVCIGIAVGLFHLPNIANKPIERWNAYKAGAAWTRYVPALPTVPVVPFQLGLDVQGGIQLLYDADLSAIISAEQDSAMQGLRDVIERRVNLFGVTEPTIRTEGNGQTRRLVVELAGIKDPNEAIRLIGQTPYLEFREPREDYQAIVVRNEMVFEQQEGTLEDPFQATQLTGRYLKKAGVEFDQFQKPVISLQFNEEGADIFAELTGRLVGRPIAIYLDGQYLQAPIVQGKIEGGRAQITGSFTYEEASRVARDLNAGALPLPIALVSQQSIGATLGGESLQKSIQAGVMGLALVMLFIIAFYRLSGLFAAISLVLYVALMLALFKLIPVTLTLAGIAGFVLSIGIAVDANILIFSRTKEELRAGKSFQVALQEGFSRAWPSIRDGNVTTLLVAFVLFWFGSSFVKGFAFTLSLGILLSMFSAIFVTRNFLALFIGTRLERLHWLWA
ncbi:MAG: protein translocase subunit SecD [Candidatus Wildermuthbacteria bacterium]|nr:protein translocase subunit SecD [Candidatus Wildermuthbacteria bacterium]